MARHAPTDISTNLYAEQLPFMLKKFIFTIGLLSCCLISFAQTTPAISNAPSQNPDLYKIDLLVFTHITSNALNSENWPDTLSQPYLKHVQELSQDLINPYQQLPTQEFGLKKEAYRIKKNGYSQIILAMSWTQPIKDNQGKWIHIQGGKFFDEQGNTISCDLNSLTPCKGFHELNGRIKLSKIGYYFNVYTRLYLTEPKTVLGNGNNVDIGDFHAVPLRTFKLFENRRTPLNTLNYIDHPLLGVLLKITKIKSNSA